MPKVVQHFKVWRFCMVCSEAVATRRQTTLSDWSTRSCFVLPSVIASIDEDNLCFALCSCFAGGKPQAGKRRQKSFSKRSLLERSFANWHAWFGHKETDIRTWCTHIYVHTDMYSCFRCFRGWPWNFNRHWWRSALSATVLMHRALSRTGKPQPTFFDLFWNLCILTCIFAALAAGQAREDEMARQAHTQSIRVQEPTLECTAFTVHYRHYSIGWVIFSLFNDSDPFLLQFSAEFQPVCFALTSKESALDSVCPNVSKYHDHCWLIGLYNWINWFGLPDVSKNRELLSLAAALPGKREARHCATNGQDGGKKSEMNRDHRHSGPVV